MRPIPLSRRDFVATAASCAGHISLAGAFAPSLLRDWWARVPVGPVVAREPFGSVEKVAEGVGAAVSAPLSGDRTTLSNGGLIAGRSGVLAVEGFNQPAGAAWLAGKAKELTGKWPTHVVLTHYHSDHANGVAGYVSDGQKPSVRSTSLTREWILTKNNPVDAARSAALADAELLSGDKASTIDLGGRTVRIVPATGHTSSDVSLEISDPSVVFCGDLVWNGMFPNFVDATPSVLGKSVRALRRAPSTIYVPGHGAVARAADFDRYIGMLDEIERAARDFAKRGVPAAEAGAGYSLPGSLGEWVLFNKVFLERAFSAWNRELK